MKLRGISEEQARQLDALCARFHVRRLGVFGSATTGDFDPCDSDFDLVVEFGPPEGMGLAEQYFGFREEAAALLGRPVDLLERSAIRNPYLRQAVETEELLLYGA